MKNQEESQTSDDQDAVAAEPEKVAEVEPETVADAKAEEADESDGEVKSGRWERFKSWLGTTKGKTIAIGVGLLVLVTGVIAATGLRYPVVGLVYKNSADIKVIDSVTKQPLSNAAVSLAGQSTTTDNHGTAEFNGLKLGKSTLTISKKAYKTSTQQVLVPIGRPKFEPVSLVSAGINISFEVTDKISGKKLDDATVEAGDSQAVSKGGQLRLALLPGGDLRVKAKLAKEGYHDATVDIEVKDTAKPYKVALVPSGNVYFLSNRSGRIDMYSSRLDGTESQVVLAGTGKEDEQTGILPSIEQPDLVAIVSSREGRRDKYGNPIQDLFIFNGDTKKLTKVEDGFEFGNYRTWVKDYLVYQKPNAQSCNSIKAYYVAGARGSTVAAGSGAVCPTINTVYDDVVLYSVSGTNSDSDGLYAIKADGAGKRRMSETPASQVSRKAKETIQLVYYNHNLPKPQVWQNLNLGNLVVSKLDSGPSTISNRAYNESLNEKLAVFVDERDGRSELYVTDHDGDNERRLTNLGSVNQFVQWYSNKYIVFSSTKSGENALYVVSVDGGQPQKVSDFYRGNSRAYGGGYNPVY